MREQHPLGCVGRGKADQLAAAGAAGNDVQAVALVEDLLDRLLVRRCEPEQNANGDVAHGELPPGAVAVGIAAVSDWVESRSRSSFAIEFASASREARRGSGSATVTGIVL